MRCNVASSPGPDRRTSHCSAPDRNGTWSAYHTGIQIRPWSTLRLLRSAACSNHWNHRCGSQCWPMMCGQAGHPYSFWPVVSNLQRCKNSQLWQLLIQARNYMLRIHELSDRSCDLMSEINDISWNQWTHLVATGLMVECWLLRGSCGAMPAKPPV